MSFPKPVSAKKHLAAKRKLPAMKTISQLEHLLDNLTSKIVRLSRMDISGMVSCYTCGTWKELGNVDCGHFISRGEKRTRHHWDNLRPQCVRCNQHLHGQHHLFREKLVREIGRDRVEALESLVSVNVIPWIGYREYLEAEIPVRKAMLKKLEAIK